MAEKQPEIKPSPERRPVVVSSGSSSNELSMTRSSGLQPISLSRGSSSSNLSSYTVPVRLDVLYFLLNSAAKGAQNPLPSLPVHEGQVPSSTFHGPPAYPAGTSCCSCCRSVPSCATAQKYVGTHNFAPAQGSCGGHGGLSNRDPRRENGGHRWVSNTQQHDGRSGSDRSRDQSPMGWKENPRWGSRGKGNGSGNSWQGRPPNCGRSYGDRRQGAAESVPWKSGSQGWRREGPPLGPNAGSNPKNQEGNRRQISWDLPDAKRRSDGAGMEWPKSQGKQEAASAKTGSASQVAQGNEEDWEEEYKGEPATSAAAGGAASRQEDQGAKASQHGKEKHARSTGLPAWGKLTSPLPEPAGKDRGPDAAAKKPGGLPADASQKSGFVTYLKNLYSDLPAKSSPESSTDLTIDTDVESSKQSEEEASPKSAAEAACK